MTEQYQQSNINTPRGSIYVDQRVIEAVDGIPGGAVVVTGDQKFIFCGDDGTNAAYNLVIPSVRLKQGLQLRFKNANAAAVTIYAQSGEQINGNPTLVVAATHVAEIVADPADTISDPVSYPIGWTLFKNGAP